MYSGGDDHEAVEEELNDVGSATDYE